MWSEMLLGALVAAAAPQDRDARRTEIDTLVPPVRVETGYRVKVDGLDITVPGVHFEIPPVWVHAYEWAWQMPEVNVHVPGFDIVGPGFDVRIPDLDIDVPVVEFPDWVDDADWYERDWYHGAHHEHAYRGEGDFQEVDTDTTFAVNAGAVLGVRNHAGEVVIRTWDRNQIRVQASHSSRDRVKILQSGSSVQIKSESRFGPPDVVDYQLTIPASMALDLWGFYTDISVDGARNGVRVETLNGEIDVRNVAGELYLRSVEGGVSVQNGQGRLEVNNVENGVTVVGFRGDLYVESIDGDIRLDNIEGQSVEAKTVDGDMGYAGAIQDNGRYRLTTHDGDIVIEMPENVNATISVATFDGEFEASFPIELKQTTPGRRFEFTLGNGSARVELHTFDGDIQLIRRGR